MDSALAHILEELRTLRAEAAARDVSLRISTESLRAEAAARDAVLRAQLATLLEGKVETPLSPSYASVGEEALAVLAASGRITTAIEPPAAAGVDESAPVATPDDIVHLLACTSERNLVATITPLLRAARGLDGHLNFADPCARVLVKSESGGWLDALHAPLPASHLKRPDLFVTWSPFWSGHMDPALGAIGKLAARALQLDGCVREFYEAKLGEGELTASDFGQLVDYHSRVKGAVRGLLFNARAFWLYESVRSHPVALVKGEWRARGSRALLRDFFAATPEPPLVPLLRHLCHELHVAPCRVTAAGVESASAAADGMERTSAFLGAGGSARVFCVVSEGAAAVQALKASTTLSRADLEYEYSMLQRAANAGAPVVSVVSKSLVFFVNNNGAHCGGGFLLRDVHTRAVLDSSARCAAAFVALCSLHAAGFAHGDARLPNLLACKRGEVVKFLWIDLREAAFCTLESAQRADVRTLAASVLASGTQGTVLPASVNAALGDIPAGGEEAYVALAAAVWSAFTAV